MNNFNMNSKNSSSNGRGNRHNQNRVGQNHPSNNNNNNPRTNNTRSGQPRNNQQHNSRAKEITINFQAPTDGSTGSKSVPLSQHIKIPALAANSNNPDNSGPAKPLPNYDEACQTRKLEALPPDECLFVPTLEQPLHPKMLPWNATKFQAITDDLLISMDDIIPHYSTDCQAINSNCNRTVTTTIISISPIPTNTEPGALIHILKLIRKATQLPIVIPDPDDITATAWQLFPASTLPSRPEDQRSCGLFSLEAATTFSSAGDDNTQILHNAVEIRAGYDAFAMWSGTYHIWPVAQSPDANPAQRRQSIEFSALRAPANSGPLAIWSYFASHVSMEARLGSVLTEPAAYDTLMVPIHFQVSTRPATADAYAGPYKEELYFCFQLMLDPAQRQNVNTGKYLDLMQVQNPQPNEIPELHVHGISLQAAQDSKQFHAKLLNLLPPPLLLQPN